MSKIFAKDKNEIEGKIKHASPQKTIEKLTRYYRKRTP
jgi:hypothetical protein